MMGKRHSSTLVLLLLFISLSLVSASGTVLVDEVYYKAYSGKSNEFVHLVNTGPSSINISGWHLSDLEGNVSIPQGTVLGPGDGYYISQTEGNFTAIMGFAPDLTFQHQGSTLFGLRNDGDEVLLLDDSGNVVDSIIYGDSEHSGDGWEGPPVPGVYSGKILERRGMQDTNTSLDWAAPYEFSIGQSRFGPVSSDADGVSVFSSPGSSLDVLYSSIMEADSSIDIGMYQFTHPVLFEALEERSQDVKVRILLEGNPVGGISKDEMSIIKALDSAGARIRLLYHEPDIHIYDRFNYLHAKYMVIDNDTIIVMSENWNTNGVPYPGEEGNRGWGAVVEDAELATGLEEIFEFDWNPKMEDSVAWDDSRLDLPEPGSSPEPESYLYVDPEVPKIENAKVTLLATPDNAHAQILELIEGAEESIQVQQLYIRNWNEMENPYLTSLYDAAERGCQINILLDNTDWDGYGGADNQYILDQIQDDYEGSNLHVRLMDNEAHGINTVHNKGMIVDGKYVLVSSINWNEHSPTENREIGIIIESEEAASYYSDIFWDDWESEDLPQLTIEMLYIEIGALAFLMIIVLVFFIKKIG